MRIPSKETIARLRERYPKGTRIELVAMDDPYCKLPTGLRGTVEFVDDTGTIHPRWDNGSGLGVVYGVDHIKIVPSEKEHTPPTVPPATRPKPNKQDKPSSRGR